MSSSATAGRPLATRRPNIEIVLAAAVIFVLTGGVSALLTQRFTTGGPDFEIWTYQYPFTLAGLIGAGLLGRHLPRLTSVPAQAAAAAAAAYVAWSLASVSWSIIPALTSSRALTTVGVVAFGVWFGTRLTAEQQMRAVAWAMAGVVVASAFLVVVVPSYGRGAFRDPTGGRFRGLSANPNSLGPLCVLSLVTFVAMAWTSSEPRRRSGWAAGAVVAVVLLVGSRSETAIATAVIAGVLAIAIATVGVLRQRGVDAQVVAGGAGLAAVAVAAGSWRLFWRISELLSGDDTFGGRRRIWNTVVGVAGLRPWRGWGYWAYWNVTNSGAIIRYGSAHNSLLEVYLGLGRIGLLLFGAIVVLAIAGVSRRLWLCYTPSTVWLAITVGTLLVGNITESFVLFHSHNWALVCGAAVGCWTWRNRDQSS